MRKQLRQQQNESSRSRCAGINTAILYQFYFTILWAHWPFLWEKNDANNIFNSIRLEMIKCVLMALIDVS